MKNLTISQATMIKEIGIDQMSDKANRGFDLDNWDDVETLVALVPVNGEQDNEALVCDVAAEEAVLASLVLSGHAYRSGAGTEEIVGLTKKGFASFINITTQD